MTNRPDRRNMILMAAHDLRNSLNCIQGYTQLLMEGNLEGDKRENSLQTIIACSSWAESLVEELMDSEAIDLGRLSLDASPLVLENLVHQAAAGFRFQCLQKRVAFRFGAMARTQVIGDGKRLLRVLLNLLVNALKHVPAETGRIAVSLRVIGADAVVEVEDNGAGIAAEDQGRLFERYFQAPGGAKGGYGLGLYISKTIIEAHGGMIWLHSDGLDRGTSFFVSLPIHELGSPGMVRRPPLAGSTIPQRVSDPPAEESIRVRRSPWHAAARYAVAALMASVFVVASACLAWSSPDSPRAETGGFEGDSAAAATNARIIFADAEDGAYVVQDAALAEAVSGQARTTATHAAKQAEFDHEFSTMTLEVDRLSPEAPYNLVRKRSAAFAEVAKLSGDANRARQAVLENLDRLFPGGSPRVRLRKVAVFKAPYADMVYVKLLPRDIMDKILKNLLGPESERRHKRR